MEKAHHVLSPFLFTTQTILKIRPIFSLLLISLVSCVKDMTPPPALNTMGYSIDGKPNNPARGTGLRPLMKIQFNQPIDTTSLKEAVNLFGNSTIIDIIRTTKNNDSVLVIQPKNNLDYLSTYDLQVDQRLKSREGTFIENVFSSRFTTGLDSTYKKPVISDETLFDTVQKQTFRYFWDFAHPVSGLIRERNNSGDLVTIGGSGFGIMAILVGIERNFISREQGLERLHTITEFLQNKADRFHGVFPHWLSGTTGKTIPFSTRDNGGDLVETSFLIAGLLCAKEYFDGNASSEANLRQKIKDIWESVEWNWHTKGGENVLYWHWSPQYEWQMNHKIEGWNEALITYVLAAASPTYPITRDVYEKGWARNGNMKNGKSFYGITLPLGYDLGGPLFFTHYSFLGIDPRNLKDQYGDYWQQNVSHSLINHTYCAANPRQYYGYSDQCWGLTASDSNNGYNAHSPTNDLGVISPTAALSSFPYTPEESKKALHFFYYVLGDKIFKEYGFMDAFNLHNLWFSNTFLAIDQGPILLMIENHRSGLLWEYTMRNEDIRDGLTKLGFTY